MTWILHSHTNPWSGPFLSLFIFRIWPPERFCAPPLKRLIRTQLKHSILALLGRYSGAPGARRAHKQSPILIWERKEIHGWIFSWFSWLAVLLVGAYGRRRRRRRRRRSCRPNMAAILQLIGRQRHVASVSSRRMPFFLAGFFKEKKTHFYLLCRQTIAEVDLMFLR